MLLAMGLVGVGGLPGAAAQTSVSASVPAAAQWRLVLDGARAAWPDTVQTASADRVRPVARRVLRHFRRRGHYYARVDSVALDTSAATPSVRLHVHRGPRVRLGALRIVGDSALSAGELRPLMQTEIGEPLRRRRLEADIQALLDRYERAGHPLAQVRVAETRLIADAPPHLRITLRIDEGPRLWLRRIEVPDDARTSPQLLAHLAGLDAGDPLRNYDPDGLRERLQGHDIFERVGPPELRVTADGGAVLRIPVDEAPPGAFDAVLGYLPPSQTRESGRLVGSGHLLLEHVFGGGRRAEFALDRRPGRTSIFDVSVADPYLLGLPLRIAGHFRGEQRDSTYGERVYELEGGYRLGTGLELTVTLSREVVRPGPAGTAFVGGRQQIPRATTLFYGGGVRFEQIDRPENPRRGLAVRLQVSQGRKERRRGRLTPQGDTTRATEDLRQERVRGRVRAYLPLFDRQVLALGGEASVLLSRDYDRSDLFRLGGAASLRGYDEDRFLGNAVARGLLEYRLQLDRASYAHAFVDLGYVARPALEGTAATQGWHPGYGLGAHLQTAIGRLSATYALNPDVQSPADGRVHLGLSVGL